MIKEILFREEDLMDEVEVEKWKKTMSERMTTTEMAKILEELGVDDDPLELLGKRRVVCSWTRPEVSGPDDGDNLD